MLKRTGVISREKGGMTHKVTILLGTKAERPNITKSYNLQIPKGISHRIQNCISQLKGVHQGSQSNLTTTRWVYS